MTLKNRLSYRELRRVGEDDQERNSLLLKAFGDGQRGLTLERLAEIRQFRGTLYEKAIHGAQVLLQSLLEIGMPQDNINAQFTFDNLAALVYEEWENFRLPVEELRREIIQRHQGEFDQKSKSFNFRDLSYAQLFREAVSYQGIYLYQGNLYTARSFWKRFQPSNEDFLANISLPLKIEHMEALLLGIYLADGRFRKSSKSSVTFVVQGEQSDLDPLNGINMYAHVVAPLLKRVHNYGPITSESYVNPRKNGKKQTPYFEINSAAISSWLRDDLGFSAQQNTTLGYKQKRIPFEHLDGKAKQYFLAGIVAGLGKWDKGDILFELKDKQFIQDIAELCQDLGYSPSTINERSSSLQSKYHTKKPIWHFTLSMNDIKNMLAADIDTDLPHVGLLFNPKHYRMPIYPVAL